MKTQNIAALLMDSCNTVSCRFKGSETLHTYKTNFKLEEGEFCVVFESGQFKIAKVEAVHKVPQIDIDSSEQYQWIVQKVDDSAYQELNRLEAEFNDHLLELEQKALKANAINMLIEKLGVKSSLIESAVNKLNGV